MKTIIQKSLLLLSFLVIASQAFSQKFVPPIDVYSITKESYLVTATGDTIRFLLRGLSQFRYPWSNVSFIIGVAGMTADGQELMYSAEDIRLLALANSKVGQLVAYNESAASILKSRKTDYSKIKRDYVFFNQEHIEHRKGKRLVVLFQLLNPGFDQYIKVYQDPRALKTEGVGIARIKITGGLDRSYYVNWNGQTCRLKKGKYKKKFIEMFGKCPELMAEYRNRAWRDFDEHVFFYDQNCSVK